MVSNDQKQAGSGRPNNLIKKIGTSFAIAGLSLAIALTVIEVVLRLGLISNPRHTLLETRGTLDGAGARVTIVGDSFIYKGGQLDNYLLDRFEDERYEVQNLARPGMNPVDYLFQLKQNAGSFKPDLILFCYYAGNDLSGAIHRTDDQRGKRGWIKTRIYNPLKKLYVVSFLSTMRSISANRGESGKLDSDTSELAQWGRDNKVNPFFIYAPERVKKTFVAENLIVDTPHSRSGLPIMREILEESNAIANRLGAKLAIVVFPSTLQVNTSHYPFFETAGFTTHEELLTTSNIQDELAAIADSLQLPYLDLLPVYRARADEEHYQDYNIHFNESGNTVAADAMKRFTSDLLSN